MTLPMQNNETFTYGDYMTWPENERWELIDGIAFDMTPAPSRRHQDISRNLSFEIQKFLTGKTCILYIAPFDVRFPDGKEPDEYIKTVVQPDISVICDPSKLDDRGCKGAPDFIAEIVSPATAKKDRKYKLLLYMKHGVKEYWVIHPLENIVMVYQLDDQGQYGRATVYGQTDKIPLALKDGTVEIDMSVVF
ncbi:MAG: Uma2 family endonuclease [bacterium]|nr:Uma2 family endonuclease [bacterium]